MPCVKHLFCFLLILASVLGQDAEEEGDLESEGVPVLAKCCPLGEGLTAGGCAPSTLPFSPSFWPPDEPPPPTIDLLIGVRCPYGRYRLEPEVDSRDEYHLLANGSLLLPFAGGLLGPWEYCLDSGPEGPLAPYLCFDPPPPSQRWKDFALSIYPIGCLISVPFLLVTIGVFLGVRTLRDAQGIALSSHCAALAIAYTSLAVVQMTGSDLPHHLCVTIAFIVQFSFLCCFFWLNVLCYHTWWKMTLSEDRRMGRDRRGGRRLLLYNFYGWGCPLAILVISLVMDLTPSIPSTYLKPNFGVDACWFHKDEGGVPYFYGPIALLLIANLVLFLLTARSLHRSSKPRVDDEPAMALITWKIILNRRKKLFVKCVVLFCVMGVNWTVEVISWWAGGPLPLWFATDLFNTLQGVVVFIVFVAKDARVRRLIAKEMCHRANKPV